MQIDKTVRKRAIPYSGPDDYMKVKAQMGNSSTWKADREQPAGERRLKEPCEYLPELCTQLPDLIFLRTVGCSGLASVNLLK